MADQFHGSFPDQEQPGATGEETQGPAPVEPTVVHEPAETEPKKADDTLGIISLVTGIAGLVLFFCCFGVDFVLGAVALITGILAQREQQKYALAGIILGAVVVLMNILAFLGFISLVLIEML